jgi:hypothetical protein
LPGRYERCRTELSQRNRYGEKVGAAPHGCCLAAPPTHTKEFHMNSVIYIVGLVVVVLVVLSFFGLR